MEVKLSLVKRQPWMADEDEFSNIKSKITEVKRLTSKRKDHPYVDEFMKECMVMFAYGTYVSEGEIDPNFSSSETWNLMQNPECELSDGDKSIRRRLVNCMNALKYLQLEPKEPLTVSHIKHIHKMIMHKEKHKNGKDVLVGEYRKTPVFAGFKTFAPVSVIERLMNDALRRYYSSDDDPISVAANLFSDVINIHPFEDGNGRLCRVILSHVLVQSGCSLFPVLLSSFHKRGRRHYIQAVKRYYENPSMLYTMITASLVRVWDNFEQNVQLLEKSGIYG